MAFEAQERIQTLAEAYALDAVDFAKQHFSIDLDWSDNSVEHIESILEVLHQDFLQSKPTQEKVSSFGKMFGSYVGEVFRRNHGARWGIITLGEESMPGLEAEITRGQFWPWAKVEKRIENGPEDNVWHYFQVLRSSDGKGPKLEQLDLSRSKRSWWRKLTGGT